MSKVIPWKERALSDEEKEYLNGRGLGYQVETNERMEEEGEFHNPPPSDDEDDDSDEDDREDDVRRKARGLTVSQLKHELDTREIEYPENAKKDALVELVVEAVMRGESEEDDEDE